MKNKLIGIFVCTVLIAITIIPVSGIDNIEKTELEEQYFIDKQEIARTKGDDVDWWSMFQHDPENIGYSTSTAPNTDNILWTFTAKNGYGLYASAAVVDNRVYTGSVGVDIATGSVRWPKDNHSGKVYCLDAETGDLIWEYLSRYGLFGTPAVVEGRVYVCTGLWYYNKDDVSLIKKGDAFCLDAEDGSLLWEYPDVGYMEGGPVVVDGRVYFASKIDKEGTSEDYGVVYCLDAETGNKLWSRIFYSPRGPVAVSDGKIYVGLQYWGDATTEILFCLNASNGETIWSLDEGNRDEMMGAPTVVGGNVYIATCSGDMYCLNADTGHRLWKADFDDSFDWCSPAVAYGNIYVGSGLFMVKPDLRMGARFYCINATDGTIVWNRSIWGITTGLLTVSSGCYSPAVADGKVFFGLSCLFTGKFFCLDAFTGETIWKCKRLSHWGAFYCPAVADGKVFVSYDGFFRRNGKLVCFGE